MKNNGLPINRHLPGRVSNVLLDASLTILLAAVLTACQTGKPAKVTAEKQLAESATGKPAVIYIADFELSAANVKHEEGPLSSRTGPASRVTHRVGERLSGAAADPAVRAREVVGLMSNSLVKDLTKAGFKAQRLAPEAALPSQGWLLRGVFVEVQEGNRVRRAMVGLGQGQTDIQVIASLDDLAQGAPKPLYEVATDASSGAKPGVAPTLVLSPYGAAARFVLAGHDLEQNVSQTAAEIAARISQRFP